MEFPLPSVEDQDRMVKESTESLRSILAELFQGDEHKTFRLMIKNLLPLMSQTPASSTVRYHGAWAGGLLVHTVEVIKMALSLVDLLGRDLPSIQKDGPDEFKRSVVRAGILHDIGKIGDGDTPYYLPQDNEWRKQNLGETYQINRDLNELIYLPIPVRGLWVAQKFGVFLTQEEVQAIVASDGPQTDLGKVVSTFLETPLTMVTHFSDLWVSQVRRV